jgi:cyanophycinase
MGSFCLTLRASLGLCALMLLAAPVAAQDYRDANFDYWVIGDPAAPHPAHTEQGLALMGGGGAVDEAYRFIARHAAGGHIVVLGADDHFDPSLKKYNQSFSTRWGPVQSSETIIFHNRKAAYDPRVLAVIAGADGIFLMGGDQGDYIRFWKGTPVQDALNAHVAANRPIGGSSAGLAILGHYSYAALAGSLESKTALADPFDSDMTLEEDFLRFAWLDKVVTDTHFAERQRMGRLIAFVARFDEAHPGQEIFGIGVDEGTALLVGQDGKARIAEGSKGSVWLVIASQPASVLAKGQPLSIRDLEIDRLDAASLLDLADHAVQHPAAKAKVSIDKGGLTEPSIISPILQRDAPPPHED